MRLLQNRIEHRLEITWRRITETREALEQQTATAEVLRVINSSPGDLAPVFDAMLEEALHLSRAAFGTLWIYDSGNMIAVATRGVPGPFDEFLRAGPHKPESVVQQDLVDGKPFAQVPDLSQTEAYRMSAPLPRAAVDLGGIRTILGVPLRRHTTSTASGYAGC